MQYAAARDPQRATPVVNPTPVILSLVACPCSTDGAAVLHVQLSVVVDTATTFGG